MWLLKNKWKIFALLLALLSLGVAFWMGGDQEVSSPEPPPVVTTPEVPDVTQDSQEDSEAENEPSTEEVEPPELEEPETESAQPPVPTPEVTPDLPPEKEEEVATVTLSISCATVLNNWDKLDASKQDIIPTDGIIFPETEIPLQEGESAFDLLLQVTREEKIHLEYSATPVYQSAYLEGIGNLYEFDCGPLSGWVYKVNGWSPNYGSSMYTLENGDKVEILYTCNLGADVGGTMVTE